MPLAVDYAGKHQKGEGQHGVGDRQDCSRHSHDVLLRNVARKPTEEVKRFRFSMILADRSCLAKENPPAPAETAANGAECTHFMQNTQETGQERAGPGKRKKWKYRQLARVP